MPKARAVVIAVDASEHSMNAFNNYVKEIYKKDDVAVICHIPELPNFNAFSLKHGLNLPVDEWKKAMEEQIRKVNALETKYQAELVSKKIPYRIRIEYDKSPGQAILNVAENENARIIVMGTRGMDSMRRTFLGSVTDYVIHHSKVPVCVCPGI